MTSADQLGAVGLWREPKDEPAFSFLSAYIKKTDSMTIVIGRTRYKSVMKTEV